MAVLPSVRVGTDDLATCPRTQSPVDLQVDAALEDPNRPVAECEVRHSAVTTRRVPVIHVRTRRRVTRLEEGHVAMIVIGVLLDSPHPDRLGVQVAPRAQRLELAVESLTGGQGLRQAIRHVSEPDAAV